jgi:hypothetical protein
VISLSRRQLIPSLALLAIPSLCSAQIRTCPTAGTRAQQARSFAADYITDPSHSAVRARYGIVAGDTSNLVIVTADSICEAVTATVDASSGTSHPQALIVIAFQNFFLGVDPNGLSVDAIYLLDSLYRPKGIFFAE